MNKSMGFLALQITVSVTFVTIVFSVILMQKTFYSCAQVTTADLPEISKKSLLSVLRAAEIHSTNIAVIFSTPPFFSQFQFYMALPYEITVLEACRLSSEQRIENIYHMRFISWWKFLLSACKLHTVH